MSTISNDYSRFLLWLAARNPSENVCRLANIIEQSIDTLAPLSTASSKRSKTLVPGAAKHWLTAAPSLAGLGAESVGSEAPWKKLETLTLGPFRGFMREEEFLLSSPTTLIYGANGAGKSSFFEALEYALLGSVGEADKKRIKEAVYFKNSWVNTYNLPTLTALDKDGESVPVSADEELYRFCFVEKNRIDEFSRIASKSNGERQKSIATLFGIEEFSRFVRGFSSSIDSCLNLEGCKSQELEDKKRGLISAQKLVDARKEKLLQWGCEQEAITQRFGKPIGYAELQAHLGTKEKPGRLQEINKRLAQPSQPVSGVECKKFVSLLSDLREHDRILEQGRIELGAKTSQLSFKALYEALGELETECPNHCPACETPLAGEHVVTKNPYQNAKDQLADLKDLADLQAKVETATDKLGKACRDLHTELGKLPALAAETALTIPKRADDEKNWWRPFLDLEGEAHADLLASILDAEAADKKVNELLLERSKLGSEHARLDELKDEIVKLEERKSEWEQQFQAANKEITQFKLDHAELIKAADDEQPTVLLHQEIKEAYDSFMGLLTTYLAELPGTLLANLGSKALVLYNAFNQDDLDHDRLSTLELPTASNEKIEISFIGSKDKKHDALHILSEGHLRCLGLALLVAKNIQQDCPALVFDDVVNAIDDDHRNGIIETLFGDSFLDKKQIILTCHGKEFIASIEQKLGAERAKKACSKYELLPLDGDRHPVVRKTPRTKNYTLIAQEELKNQDYGEALSKVRKGLEFQTQELWRWMEKRGFGSLSITLDYYGMSPRLRNLCEAQSKALKKWKTDDPCKDSILDALNSLLGIGGQSLEWSYLNKGTHYEDRPEFDKAIVQTIVEALTKLDSSIQAPRRSNR